MIARSKLLAALALVLLATVGVLAVFVIGGDDAGGSEPPFRPEPEADRDPFPANLSGPGRYPVAHISGRQLLYRRPGGQARVRIAGETEWNNPRVLSVVGHRRDWLAVLVPELKNGQVGWIRMSQVERLQAIRWSVHVDRSRREVVVRRGGKPVRRLRVGVGRLGHDTPTGRFAVTDRLRVTDPASPYGCCVLALTGHQSKLPPGWPGGDRLAFHATADLSNLGQAVSLGCMRSDPKDARWLIERVPLGTPVFIRA